MKYKEGAVIGALSNADGYLEEHHDELARDDPPEFERNQQLLRDVLARLRAFGVEQDTGARGSRGETARQRQLRIDLHEQWLKPIARIARHNLRKVPEYAALKLPKPAKGFAFARGARAMVDAAAAHRDALVAYGLPKSFVEDVNKALDRFESSLNDRDRWQTQRAVSTKGLESLTSEGRTVLGVLDSLVARSAHGDEVLLHGWKAARHIKQRPGPVSGASESAAAAPDTATTPASDRPLSIA